jgi:hypothetical protein
MYKYINPEHKVMRTYLGGSVPVQVKPKFLSLTPWMIQLTVASSISSSVFIILLKNKISPLATRNKQKMLLLGLAACFHCTTDTVSHGTDTVSHGTDTVSQCTDTVSHGTDTVSHGTDTVSHGTDTVSHCTDTPKQARDSFQLCRLSAVSVLCLFECEQAGIV